MVEIFERKNNIVNDKLSEFIMIHDNSIKKTKQFLHYQSVINISREIIKHNDSKADDLKDLLIQYMELVKNIDYQNHNYINNINDKEKQSLELYNKYIAPIGLYLVSKGGFVQTSILIVYLIIGILLDVIVYFLLTKNIIPIFTILLTFIGLRVGNNKRKTNKMFSPFY